MHEEDVEISPFKTRVKLRRCAECGRPMETELVEEALRRRGGPTLVECLAGDPLCPRCKRGKSARSIIAAVPRDGLGECF